VITIFSVNDMMEHFCTCVVISKSKKVSCLTSFPELNCKIEFISVVHIHILRILHLLFLKFWWKKNTVCDTWRDRKLQAIWCQETSPGSRANGRFARGNCCWNNCYNWCPSKYGWSWGVWNKLNFIHFLQNSTIFSLSFLAPSVSSWLFPEWNSRLTVLNLLTSDFFTDADIDCCPNGHTLSVCSL